METLWYFFWDLAWYEMVFVALFLTGAIPLIVNEVVHLAGDFRKVVYLFQTRPVLAIIRFIDVCLGIALCAPGHGYIILRESIIKSVEK